MKTKKILWFVLLAGIVLIGGLSKIAGVCPDPIPVYDPNTIPFEYDPNTVWYKILGSIQVHQESTIREELFACDPDDDPIVISLFDGPAGVSVVKDGETYFLNWTPTVLNLGVYVVNIKAVDQPEFDDALEDYGSILIKVYRKNQAPILLPCCGG